VWYHHVTPEKLDRILEEHVVGGKPVEADILYQVPECGKKNEINKNMI